MTVRSGSVVSHTTIRVAGKAHADEVPFVLLLVEGDRGERVLARFSAEEPPPIGARVRAGTAGNGVPVFELEEGA